MFIAIQLSHRINPKFYREFDKFESSLSFQ
uniref:Uncharacterized protein n=1 Tax=Rhizophora mucronata TaxID=61149 RepID=A0A2P2L2E8_RHIMU